MWQHDADIHAKHGMISTLMYAPRIIGGHGEMVIGTHTYEEFFLEGDRDGRLTGNESYCTWCGEKLNDFDYAKYLVMEKWRIDPRLINKYHRGKNLCYADFDHIDIAMFAADVAAFKLLDPCPAKFRDIGVQKDWYEHTGVFAERDTERVKRIIGQVRDNREYMKQYRIDKLAGLR